MKVCVVVWFVFILYSFICISFLFSLTSGGIKIRRYFSHTQTVTLHASRFIAYIFYGLQRAVGLVYVEEELSTPTFWRISYFRLSQYRIETGRSDWTRGSGQHYSCSLPLKLLFLVPSVYSPNPLTLLWFRIPSRRILIASIISESPNFQVNIIRKPKNKEVHSCE